MAQVLPLISPTSSPGTMRNKSSIFVAPDRRMSSWVITNIAAATRDSFCPFFEADVTSMFIRSSMLTFVRSGACCWALVGIAASKAIASGARIRLRRLIESRTSRAYASLPISIPDLSLSAASPLDSSPLPSARARTSKLPGKLCVNAPLHLGGVHALKLVVEFHVMVLEQVLTCDTQRHFLRNAPGHLGIEPCIGRNKLRGQMSHEVSIRIPRESLGDFQ